jgi:Family of unknown function (DUF6364)
METTKLTIRLPRQDLEFAKRYAQAHRISLTQLIDRYFQSLQRGAEGPIHPEVWKISGLAPETDDTRAEYREHLLRKHQ